MLEKYPTQEVLQLNDFLADLNQFGWQPDTATQLKGQLTQLQSALQEQIPPSIEILIQKVEHLLAPLIETDQAAPSQDQLMTLQAILKKLQEAIAVNLSAPESVLPLTPHHTLIVAINDKKLTEEITQQLKYFNYTCISAPNLANTLQLSADTEIKEKLGVILLDTDYCQIIDLPALKTVSTTIPIIFISTHDEVASRLFAVKAGAAAYFVRPIEFTSLIEKIDELLTPPSESPPYRILIVEDSRTQASIISNQLKKAGMITEVLMDPLKINEVLMEFQPELILLDLYMPQCTGLELAQVIRQQPPYVSIPIVYLSAEEDTNKQLSAMEGGGDDFLTKPISPHHLVTAVTTRAQRSRTLRAEMTQDSLTGLLNHTRILEQLDLEIARARRNKMPLSFAMIDIDHFKSINDSHGHPVGDRVIKGLARLLKQHLRKIDSIGRYGGEEFALILPQSDGISIMKKLEEIRRGFSKLLHRSSDPMIEFTATFSVGLAQMIEQTDTVDKLVHAADKALYLAKEQGRNCIVFYNQET